MLVAAAICPEAPFLLTGLSGQVDPEPVLSRACAEAVAWLVGVVAETGAEAGTEAGTEAGADAGARLVVVGGGRTTTSYPLDAPFTTGPFLGLGNPHGPAALPAALGLGRQLVAAAGGEVSAYQSIANDATPAQARALGRTLVAGPERTALLVLGDGSGRRGPKAPGYLDTRSAAYDEQVVAAITAADSVGLAALDPELGAHLLCRGRAAFQVLGGALEAPQLAHEMAQGPARDVSVRVTYQGDPFGVLYVVAALRRNAQTAAETAAETAAGAPTAAAVTLAV